jgi:hypothetical protein
MPSPLGGMISSPSIRSAALASLCKIALSNPPPASVNGIGSGVTTQARPDRSSVATPSALIAAVKVMWLLL